MKTSMQKTAAVAALLTASIGNAFSQEPQGASNLSEPSTPASAPLEPPAVPANDAAGVIKEVDAILSKTEGLGGDLQGSYFPRVPKASRDLLATTLGEFNRDDFEPRVYRSISGDNESDIVVSFRLTRARTNPGPLDGVKASPVYIDYRLPLFEAARFEINLREKKFEIVELSGNAHFQSDGVVIESQQTGKPQLNETEKKIVVYVIGAFVIAAGAVALWTANAGLRMFRWLTKQKPDTPMAHPLPIPDPAKAQPWESFQITTWSGVEEPMLSVMNESSGRLHHSINGGSQPMLSLSLKPGEAIVAETGSLLMKDKRVSMKRVSGRDEGYAPDALGFVKRWLMGESFWFLKFRNESEQSERLILSPSKVGTMLNLNLAEYPDGLVADGGSFFAAGRGVKLATSRVLSLGGILSGLGPFQQRMTGNGEVFLFSSGEVRELRVEKDKPLLLDPDAVFAWEPTVTVQAKWLGLWSGIVSGEGFFLCSVSGEGRLFYSSRGMRDDPAKDRTGGPTGLVGKYIDKLT